MDYHGVVSWVAAEARVDKQIVKEAPTFPLEQALFKVLFVGMWDKLSESERKAVLAHVDPNNSLKDKAAIAALGGAGALAALSGTVALAGFAFYTTMSVTMAAVAGLIGATLPFASYAGASALVGMLSGPVGWAVVGLAGLGGLALKGRANAEKSTAMLLRIHSLKVEALQAARVPEEQVFTG
ncbi:hypothetical protein WKW80_32470 [Variovorax humicola]|uniref:Uncharacterized protein n=1 Tax=Variovorax humicola TaxID=1769758 RepID=A0ABU8W9G2_9BURK